MATNQRVVSNKIVTLSPAQLKQKIPSNEKIIQHVNKARLTIENILNGRDKRLLVIVGPCSIHDPEAALEYARQLKTIQNPNIFIVMRTYFEKPRTSVGWSGLISDPDINGTCNVAHGLQIARQLLIDINEMGIPCATEMLSMLTPQYIDDLISFVAIGARTVESQPHRELASGLSMPVGFKNNSEGKILPAVHAILSAAEPKTFIGCNDNGQISAVQTVGNTNCCVILRGSYTNGPNYSHAHLEECKRLQKEKGQTLRAIIDASHGNSNKSAQQQIQVITDIIHNKHDFCGGIMIESFLEHGNQKKPEIFGKSITDECIGWKQTEIILNSII